MPDLIETHRNCPICGLRVSLTETGKMRKNPKHENCIGDGKSHISIQTCLRLLSLIDVVANYQITSENDSTFSNKESILSQANCTFASNVVSNFPDIPGEDYRKIRHSKFQKDRYLCEHADEIVTNFRQALASSRALMGTPKEP